LTFRRRHVRPGADGATDLTLVHERLDALRAAMPHVADHVGTGWGTALDKLERNYAGG
jgi:hypothetical protein